MSEFFIFTSRPERLHPVDSLVQGLLHKKEIFRSLTRKTEKIRKEKEDAGRDKAIKVNVVLIIRILTCL